MAGPTSCWWAEAIWVQVFLLYVLISAALLPGALVFLDLVVGLIYLFITAGFCYISYRAWGRCLFDRLHPWLARPFCKRKTT